MRSGSLTQLSCQSPLYFVQSSRAQSTDSQLHAYAHARDAKHLPAWAEFNRRIGGDGSVGIWHETYTVAPEQYECIYANMPRFGLARAAEHVTATGRLEQARSRIKQGKNGGA